MLLYHKRRGETTRIRIRKRLLDHKSKQKREKYHPLAVNKIAEMYGFSARYVRQILKGDRKGLMADNVLRDYKELCKKIDQATEKAMNTIINQ